MLGASEGVSSIWNDDISITWTRSRAGGSSSRMAVPMLPPICTSRPAERRMWAISAVVVDLPLVPVMATKGASGQLAARSRQNSSMSPMISTPAALALATVQCGSGWVSGTPGASTRAAKRLQSASAEVLHAEARRRGRLPAARRVVGGDDGRAAGQQRAAGGQPRAPEAEHGNGPAGECGDRGHAGSLSRVALQHPMPRLPALHVRP